MRSIEYLSSTNAIGYTLRIPRSESTSRRTPIRLPLLSNTYFALSSSLIPLIFHFHRFTLFWFVVSVVVASASALSAAGSRMPSLHLRAETASGCLSAEFLCELREFWPESGYQIRRRSIASPVIRAENSIEEIPLATGSSEVSPPKSTSGSTRTGWPLTIRTASLHSRSPIAATFKVQRPSSKNT